MEMQNNPILSPAGLSINKKYGIFVLRLSEAGHGLQVILYLVLASARVLWAEFSADDAEVLGASSGLELQYVQSGANTGKYICSQAGGRFPPIHSGNSVS